MAASPAGLSSMELVYLVTVCIRKQTNRACWRRDNRPDLYSGGARFEPKSRHRYPYAPSVG
jgi:hypothetical protein